VDAAIVPLEGKRLLDIGAGSGKLVRFLRGASTHGVEPSRALFDRFRERTRHMRHADNTVSEAAPSTSSRRSTSSSTCRIRSRSSATAALLKPGGVFFASTLDAAAFRQGVAAGGISTTGTTCRISRREHSRRASPTD
jgi:hypothetical protein